MTPWTRRGFLGWRIVAGSMGIRLVPAGFFPHAYGPCAPFRMEEFGWNETTTALAFALQRTESGSPEPLHGWTLERFVPRGASSSSGSCRPLTTVIAQRFERRRGTASAFMQSGMNLGGPTVPLLAWALLFSGRRGEANASGLLDLAVGIPLPSVPPRSGGSGALARWRADP